MPGRLALAHRSDFRTFTLDFMIGQDGLKTIDAAVGRALGPSYEPFPSAEEKRRIAVDVLDALAATAEDFENRR